MRGDPLIDRHQGRAATLVKRHNCLDNHRCAHISMDDDGHEQRWSAGAVCRDQNTSAHLLESPETDPQASCPSSFSERDLSWGSHHFGLLRQSVTWACGADTTHTGHGQLARVACDKYRGSRQDKRDHGDLNSVTSRLGNRLHDAKHKGATRPGGCTVHRYQAHPALLVHEARTR